MTSLPETRGMLAETYARELDAADSLARIRKRFYMEPGTICLDGNWLIFRGFGAKAIYSRSGDHLR